MIRHFIVLVTAIILVIIAAIIGLTYYLTMVVGYPFDKLYKWLRVGELALYTKGFKTLSLLPLFLSHLVNLIIIPLGWITKVCFKAIIGLKNLMKRLEKKKTSS